MSAVRRSPASRGRPEDFTYGGAFKQPSGAAVTVAVPGLTYPANNSEVMAVLLDVETWPAAPGVPPSTRAMSRTRKGPVPQREP